MQVRQHGELGLHAGGTHTGGASPGWLGLDGRSGRRERGARWIDEFTREALATDVARSIDADGVVTCLERLAAERGAPIYVRFDHGPEFIAQAVADWCRFRGTGTVFIDPGSPWQNAWIEGFNGRMRDEFPNGTQFDSPFRGSGPHRGLADRRQQPRPHSAHGWLTPVEFVGRWVRRQQLQLAERVVHQAECPH
jgi:putative transposase